MRPVCVLRGSSLRILFLEDDPETAESIRRGLGASGFEVCHAGDVDAARALLRGAPFDVAILDIMVPGGSGFDVLGELRASAHPVPALMLTARDSLDDRVDGLERGADDYLVKPFAFAELLARVRALLRRPTARDTGLRIGALELDPLRRRAEHGGRRVELTRTEADLLAYLVERRGESVSRRTLLERIWGYRFDPGTNVVDVAVNRLRRKLEEIGAGNVVRTVRGIGYVVD